jgi:hypothetical protein
MDFVSGYQGAIPAINMRSPGQFDHRLIGAAKARVAQAAIQNRVIPCTQCNFRFKKSIPNIIKMQKEQEMSSDL